MGVNARVALFAPTQLAPYVSLPSTFGGSTAYFSTKKINGTMTWEETAIPGCMYSGAASSRSVSGLTNEQILRRQYRHSQLIETPARLCASIQLPSHCHRRVVSPPIASATPTSAAMSTTSSPTSIESTSSSSDTESTSTTNSPAADANTASTSSTSAGLSTGAKVGIGVGVAGGVLLLAAVALAAYLLGKRPGQSKGHPVQQGTNLLGAQSPPQPFPSPAEKPYGWQPGYHQGPRDGDQAFFNPTMPISYPFDVHPDHSVLSTPPMNERAQRGASSNPEAQAAELPVDREPHEMQTPPLDRLPSK